MGGGRFPAAALVEYLECRFGQLSVASARAAGWTGNETVTGGERSTWLTHDQMAEACGVSRELVSKWCSRGNVPADRVDEVACTLGVHPLLIWPLEWTLFGSGAKPLAPEHEAAYISRLRRESMQYEDPGALAAA